jgi:hypothetical protein
MKYTLKGGILQAFLEQICYFFQIHMGGVQGERNQGDPRVAPSMEANVG